MQMNDEFYQEFAAVTRKRSGNGMTYYIGCGLEEKITKLIIERIMMDCDIAMNPSEAGVEIVDRCCEDQKITMYINHNAKAVTSNGIELAPFECKIAVQK